MNYQVVKKGHKVGHTPLRYGAVVSAQSLGVKAEALAPFIARGVLVPAKPKAQAPTPVALKAEPKGTK